MGMVNNDFKLRTQFVERLVGISHHWSWRHGNNTMRSQTGKWS